MEGQFVKIEFDLHCDWIGFPPEYRLYVNDELLTERSYTYSEPQYIREILQLNLTPGEYELRLEKVGPQMSTFKIENSEVAYGPAQMIDNTRFTVK